MMIEWESILELCPDIRGIIHVGAYNASEAKYYADTPVKWVEACPDLYKALKVKPKYHFCALDYNGTVRFNRMEFSPANSILEPNLNAIRRRDVRITDTILVPARRLETIQEDENMIVADIQGSELLMLKGADLTNVDYLLLEVHTMPTYHDCPMVGEIDDFLTGFDRVLTKMTKQGWGDALYIRL